MDTRKIIEAAKAEIEGGFTGFTLLASNEKTGASIGDNLPYFVCYAQCPLKKSCYDVRQLRQYPNMLRARARRHFLLFTRPDIYVEKAVNEIQSSGLRAVRIFAGGDYVPSMLPTLRSIMGRCPEVSFYMISKTIRFHIKDARVLLKLNNFHLNLSAMPGIEFVGPSWDKIRQHVRCKYVYTLMPDDQTGGALGAEIVFNVDKKAPSILTYKGAGYKLCPCDAKDTPRVGACARCRQCYTARSA